MTDEKYSRRRLLQGALAGIAAVPAATLIARTATAGALLSESDPTPNAPARTMRTIRSGRSNHPARQSKPNPSARARV